MALVKFVSCFSFVFLLYLVATSADSFDVGNHSTAVPLLNGFSFRLFDSITKRQKPEDNIFFSPLSVYQSLALLLAGAGGNTKDELGSALTGKKNNKFQHGSLGSLAARVLSGTDNVSLKIGNRIWMDKKFSISSSYSALVKKCYGVKVKQLNFENSEKCRGIINKWISKMTNGNIKELLQKGSVNSQTRLLLTNAIHFKGAWTSTFDKNQTKEDDFTLVEGKEKKKVKANFMKRLGKVLYNRVESSDLQVIDLPYGSGRFSLSLFLPAEESAHVTLTLSAIQEALKDMRPVKMQLMLPKFKIDWKYGLEKVLPDLGLKTLFTSSANFSGLTMEQISVSNVIHQAQISVDERGTEASAATAIVLGRSFVPIFKANRPFTFVIRENSTGAVLFVGKLNKPSITD